MNEEYYRPWLELPPSFRTGARGGAIRKISQLRRLGFSLKRAASKTKRTEALTIDELEWIAEDEHKLWYENKRSLGWVYGSLRNNATREHPALIKWAELSDSYKEIERNGARDVSLVLANAGFELVRTPA